MRKSTETKGITLIALVITIIVLLILAAVSIATLTGDNGILTKAQTASEKTKEASVKEEIQTEIMAAFDNTGSFDAKIFKTKMEEAGATVTEEGEDIIIEKDGYEATIDAKTGKIKNFESSKGVKPVVKATVEKTGDNKAIIKVEITNEVEKVDSITVTNLDTGDTYEVTVNGKTGSCEVEKNGTYKIEVKATTEGVQKAGETTILVNVIPVEFTKAQGKIDVIWVNTKNEKIDKPLVPDTLPSGMKKVYWKEDGTEVKEGDAGFTESNWYNYVAGDNKNDTKTSKWANAINTIEGVESYFVWIPRYAYRITYLTTDGQVAGYCDGKGTREITADGENVKEELKAGTETTEEYDGLKYIVHPAFVDESELTVPYKNGGWDSDLEGIWVGKYESARSTADENSAGSGTTAIQIAPTVKSWVSIDIGTMYTNALNYDKTKESHLMKNSEWGACSYLTYSQYGRNRNEVAINRCSSVVTGMGSGESTSEYVYSAELTAQMYNGEEGQKASSTGNIYGVYDLSGGASEYVAAFNNAGSNLSNGSIFAGTDGNSKDSTKYATKYTSDSSTPTYEKYYPGDATFEVYTGSGTTGWNGDSSIFVYSSYPFFNRGGYYYGGPTAGVFSASRRWHSPRLSFVPCGLARRVALCDVTLSPSFPFIRHLLLIGRKREYGCKCQEFL